MTSQKQSNEFRNTEGPGLFSVGPGQEEEMIEDMLTEDLRKEAEEKSEAALAEFLDEQVEEDLTERESWDLLDMYSWKWVSVPLDNPQTDLGLYFNQDAGEVVASVEVSKVTGLFQINGKGIEEGRHFIDQFAAMEAVEAHFLTAGKDDA